MKTYQKKSTAPRKEVRERPRHEEALRRIVDKSTRAPRRDVEKVRGRSGE